MRILKPKHPQDFQKKEANLQAYTERSFLKTVVKYGVRARSSMVSKAWPFIYGALTFVRARSSMVEQFPFKEAVLGSSPSGLTTASSSSGLGHQVFSLITWVRVPVRSH